MYCQGTIVPLYSTQYEALASTRSTDCIHECDVLVLYYSINLYNKCLSDD